MGKKHLYLCGLIALILSPLTYSEELLDSKVVSFDETHVTQYDGSAFHTYFYGNTSGTANTITGVAVIQPNNEIHPAHAHADEEFLMIIEGSGIWELNGKKFKANQGDILYTKPWDKHGLFNDSDVPLKFVIVRFSGRQSLDKGKPKE